MSGKKREAIDLETLSRGEEMPLASDKGGVPLCVWRFEVAALGNLRVNVSLSFSLFVYLCEWAIHCGPIRNAVHCGLRRFVMVVF